MSDRPTGQLAFALAGDDKASFDNFWGDGNPELLLALKASALQQESKVVYLYGPQGCGKSHLSFAAIRLAKQSNFTASYLSLSDAHISHEMLDVIDVSGLVCIDNAHSWAGDGIKERALFTLFEQIKHASGQLVVTALQAPAASSFIIPDLVSRLSSGLIYPIQTLDDEQRFLALKMRANHRGLVIGDDVLRFLLSRVSRDTAKIFALLDQVDKASLVEKRKITIPFLQSLLNR